MGFFFFCQHDAWTITFLNCVLFHMEILISHGQKIFPLLFRRKYICHRYIVIFGHWEFCVCVCLHSCHCDFIVVHSLEKSCVILMPCAQRMIWWHVIWLTEGIFYLLFFLAHYIIVLDTTELFSIFRLCALWNLTFGASFIECLVIREMVWLCSVWKTVLNDQVFY